MKNPIFAKTVSSKTIKIGARNLRNHNKLLWRLDGADGVKTGYTRAAGRILVSSVIRDGRRLIAVTINDGDDWNDHISLHNDGFSNYTPKLLVQKGECLGSISLIGGQNSQVDVLAGDDFIYSISEQEQPYILLSGSGMDFAPVVEGEDAGVAYILIGDKTVGKVPVVYKSTVDQSQFRHKTLWERLFGGKVS